MSNIKPTDPAIIRMVQALQQAGFTGPALVAMTSIGISESGGNPNALNNDPATGDYSVGAFQINYYDGLYASRSAEYGPPDQLLGNLQAQADAAYKLSGGGANMNPWKGDYSNGKFYANLPVASAAVAGVLGGATAAGAPGSSEVGSSPSAVNLGASGGDSGCLISFPGIPLPSVGPIGGGNIGAGCLMSRDQGRHILGGLCILGGIVIAALGVVMVVKNESNPSKAIGGIKNPLSGIQESRQARRDEALEKLAPEKGELEYKKKLEEKRRTYDAKTGKNYMGQTPEEVDADNF